MKLRKIVKNKKIIAVVLATIVAFTTILFSKPKTDVRTVETQKIEMTNQNKDVINMKRNITKQEIMTMGKPLKIKATAYCNDPITATGEKPTINGSCAVDPKFIPYGSYIYIPSLNLVLKCNDCGSKIKGDGRIDIYLKDYKTCKQFGIQDLTGYVITPDMIK